LIICPKCQTQLIQRDKGYICQNCQHIFSEREGVLQLISEADNKEFFFQNKKFDILYHSEEKNFWFRVRNKIIGDTITQYLPRPSHILEVGCGTGYVSRYLKAIGYYVECADLFLDALQFCKQRNAGYQYYQLNLMDTIFIQEFDAICAFDVLEHIDDDIIALKHLHDALKPGGLLFITVPADMRLWSDKDVSARHKRRYSAHELQTKLKFSGFNVIKKSYFMTFLYPVLLLSRKVSMRSREKNAGESLNIVKKEEMNELQPNRILNSIFFFIFLLEVPFIRLFSFPLGSSLLYVAVKEP
jgi:SAM-dependent methyltransferase